MALVPFDDRDGVIWMDGKLVPWREARIHVLTHALHYGSSVFDGARVYNGKVFKQRAHTERLLTSAKILGFTIPYTAEAVDEAITATLQANGLKDGYVRPFAWRGSEVMGVSAKASTIHLAIACWSWPPYYGADARTKGIRMTWAPWARPAPHTAPTHAKASGLYMIGTINKHHAEDLGCSDALMVDWRGRIAEATSANFFMVQDGVLHTPTAECILNGITRQTVMALAEAKGIRVLEREIWPPEVQLADEVFLTGSAAEITPVGQIGAWMFTPGPITRVLTEAYEAVTRA